MNYGFSSFQHQADFTLKLKTFPLVQTFICLFLHVPVCINSWFTFGLKKKKHFQRTLGCLLAVIHMQNKYSGIFTLTINRLWSVAPLKVYYKSMKMFLKTYYSYSVDTAVCHDQRSFVINVWQQWGWEEERMDVLRGGKEWGSTSKST